MKKYLIYAIYKKDSIIHYIDLIINAYNQYDALEIGRKFLSEISDHNYMTDEPKEIQEYSNNLSFVLIPV